MRIFYKLKESEPYTVLQAKINLHIAMQTNFHHAWIDNTINGEVEKLGETGSGTRRFHCFHHFLYLVSFSIVNLRTVSRMFTAEWRE